MLSYLGRLSILFQMQPQRSLWDLGFQALWIGFRDWSLPQSSSMPIPWGASHLHEASARGLHQRQGSKVPQTSYLLQKACRGFSHSKRFHRYHTDRIPVVASSLLHVSGWPGRHDFLVNYFVGRSSGWKVRPNPWGVDFSDCYEGDSHLADCKIASNWKLVDLWMSSNQKIVEV